VTTIRKKDVFSKGSIRFKVRDQKFVVRDFWLDSDSMELTSDRGYLDFDGNMKLKLSPRPKNILGPIIKGTMAVLVNGPFKDPELTTQLTLEIDKMFEAILPGSDEHK
jgi:hypothetical protein